ncbi:hypothetical protein RhiJN_17287 [Ceratobasidium sp. AG-Ba]|nr:hypothetical protein RhiJN_17287 [Ceratobasidium sp. AG-Ba]
MFTMRYALAVFTALSAVGSAVATPTGLAPRADWKDQYGWDGKSISPVQLDPSNAVRPTPGKPAPAALPGGVYWCDNVNFWQPCEYVNGFSSGQCVEVGSVWNDRISSFGPDFGIICNVFSDGNCKGKVYYGIANPGITNLGDVGMNDAISSFRCFN